MAEAAAVLQESRKKTARRLAALAERGWIERARRGLYLVRPLEVGPGEPALPEDPWIVAQRVFAPCYIGGWSAAEHWALTEQIFRETLVITAANARSRRADVLGHTFRLFRVPESRTRGASVVPLWRGPERVSVSSAERTLADCLRSPELCGGVRHLADMMSEYGRSEHRDFEKLAAAMKEVATGAAWKRLGYLAEVLWPEEESLVDISARHLTKGNARLDPAVRRRGRLRGKWRLWINVSVEGHGIGSAGI